MLAHVGGNERIPFRHLIKLFNHPLRLGDCAGAVVFEAITGPPCIDLRPPRVKRGLLGLFLARLELFYQFIQYISNIANNRNIDFDTLGYG